MDYKMKFVIAGLGLAAVGVFATAGNGKKSPLERARNESDVANLLARGRLQMPYSNGSKEATRPKSLYEILAQGAANQGEYFV